MNETISGHRININMDLNDFYTIETPPSSSTSKDSIDELVLPSQNKQQNKLIKTNPQIEFDLKPIKNSMNNNTDDQFGKNVYDEMQTPLRRTLGNTKLKTRQDVRRFRKFLKRNYDLQSMNLVDIEPETLKNYLIHYLTSIRTRKGLKYDPETLRSYYLSIQRFLKDSNYPFCLRNSPQFGQCRDLIIQMRKEKTQSKNSNFSNKTEMKTKILPSKDFPKKPLVEQNFFSGKVFSKPNDSFLPSTSTSFLNDDRRSSTNSPNPTNFSSNSSLIKDFLPSSLPPRKRQQMKYFLESRNSIEISTRFNSQSICPTVEIFPPSKMVLSEDAFELLVKFTRWSSSRKENSLEHFEKLLDQSTGCGNVQRLMLTNLCRQWTGDIRLVHFNLRKELNSFLPHILVMSILSQTKTF